MRVTLEIRDGPFAGRRFRLKEAGTFRVGRSRQMDLVVPHDARMSGAHFTIEVKASKCLVRDLNSTNGTILNGQEVTEAVLEDGSILRAGDTTFLVRIEIKPVPAGESTTTRGIPVVVSSSSPEELAASELLVSRRTILSRDLAEPAAIASRQPGASAESRGSVQKTVLPGQTPQGEPILSVLLKRTYDILPARQCVRAAADRKLIPGNVPYDDPMNSSIEFETDFIPFKLATDVVLNGKAYAPRGASTRELTASVSVGKYRKEVRVFGDRVCRYREKGDPEFTDPQPFTTMDLRYERAYGGIDIDSDPKLPCPYPRNPLGRGFVVGWNKRGIDNLPLPNLEDPNDLLTPGRLLVGKCLDWGKQPFPQNFGWFPMTWLPRASLAGVMPAEHQLHEEMRKAYARVVPPAQKALWEQTRLRDMDFQFFNGASPGLIMPYLNGDEDVRLSNLSLEGQLLLKLPGDRPRISVDIGFGFQEPPVVLHTVMIRMEDRQLDLVWRAAIPYPGPDWLPNMSKMEVIFR